MWQIFCDIPYAYAKNFVLTSIYSSIISHSDIGHYCQLTKHVLWLPVVFSIVFFFHDNHDTIYHSIIRHPSAKISNTSLSAWPINALSSPSKSGLFLRVLSMQKMTKAKNVQSQRHLPSFWEVFFSWKIGSIFGLFTMLQYTNGEFNNPSIFRQQSRVADWIFSISLVFLFYTKKTPKYIFFSIIKINYTLWVF